jgi:MFS transporter, ACS family, D-galactonate transporter
MKTGCLTGLLSSSFLSDYLLSKKVSVNIAGKAPVIFGLLLSASILGANYVDSTTRIIFFMAIAFLEMALQRSPGYSFPPLLQKT